MKTVTQHIRSHLLDSLGFAAPATRLPDLPILLQTEWSHEFERARRLRMIMGAFRYGLLTNPDKWKFDLMGGLRKHLANYESTGNTESLVDAANYLMLEFIHPSHPEARFKAMDDLLHCPTRDA